jgi:hypothetical protein
VARAQRRRRHHDRMTPTAPAYTPRPAPSEESTTR